MVAPVVLFLGLAGWSGLVALSLWPLRRPHKIAMGLYRFIYRATEVPQVVALLAVVTLAPLFVVSDLHGWSLVLAWSAVAVLALGVAVLIGNGVRARAVMDRSLVDAGLVPSVQRSRSLLSILLRPFPGQPAGVELIKNLSYGPHPRHRLDVRRRRGAATGAPVLIYFHGGGYFTGSKDRAGRPLQHHLAERGWLCLSANYRLHPEVGMAEHLADARVVVRWAREHAAEYGADPTTIVLAGSSAGAHLAALCALTQDVDSEPLAGLICMYGWFLDYAVYHGEQPDESTPTNPFALDPSKVPPTLLAHGTADVLAEAKSARDLGARFAEATAGPVVSVTFPGGQHGFDAFSSWRAQALSDGVDVFVDSVLSGRRTPNCE